MPPPLLSRSVKHALVPLPRPFFVRLCDAPPILCVRTGKVWGLATLQGKTEEELIKALLYANLPLPPNEELERKQWMMNSLLMK